MILAQNLDRWYIFNMLDIAEHIRDNTALIRERIEQACARSGRSVHEVSLMAVSKFNPFESILAAYHAGIRLFGENRVQEAWTKFGSTRDQLENAALHMIGTLQKNKVNKALALFDAIQGIDSVEILQTILARIDQRTAPLQIYFELHTGEASKAGFPNTDELFRACETLEKFMCSPSDKSEFIQLKGLMTMAPFTSEIERIRHSFRELAAAKKGIESRFHFDGFDQLSMGMSNDFEIAIEEGATLVRIGTAIFGERAL